LGPRPNDDPQLASWSMTRPTRPMKPMTNLQIQERPNFSDTTMFRAVLGELEACEKALGERCQFCGDWRDSNLDSTSVPPPEVKHGIRIRCRIGETEPDLFRCFAVNAPNNIARAPDREPTETRTRNFAIERHGRCPYHQR
jgi:hypothetical protein